MRQFKYTKTMNTWQLNLKNTEKSKKNGQKIGQLLQNKMLISIHAYLCVHQISQSQQYQFGFQINAALCHYPGPHE